MLAGKPREALDVKVEVDGTPVETLVAVDDVRMRVTGAVVIELP